MTDAPASRWKLLNLGRVRDDEHGVCKCTGYDHAGPYLAEWVHTDTAEVFHRWYCGNRAALFAGQHGVAFPPGMWTGPLPARVVATAAAPVAAKVGYVRSQGQTRQHHCHWPGCPKQVPPAKWGCAAHWYRLPAQLRVRVWNAYRPGQERDGRPSADYLAVARAVEEWIRDHGEATRRPSSSAATRRTGVMHAD